MKHRRNIKIWGLALAAVFAFSAVSVANAAAAAHFKASTKGELKGTATSNQVFTTSSGGSENVTCKKAATSGTVTELEAAAQKVAVLYTECTANTSFGAISAEISKAEYELSAAGTAKILNTITIHVGGIANCNIVVGPQGPLSSVSYANESGKIKESSAVTGIVSTSTGLCPHGTTGTYTGSNLVELVGGTVEWLSA